MNKGKSETKSNKFGIVLYATEMQEFSNRARNEHSWADHRNMSNIQLAAPESDAKLRDHLRIREDSPEHGFIYNVGNGDVFLAPSNTIHMLNGLLDTGISQVKVSAPGLLEALNIG